MSDTRLSDEELRGFADNQCEPRFVRNMARELLARRAAESEVPFAVGDKVTAGSCTDVLTVGEVGMIRLYCDVGSYTVYRKAADLTPVPPAPTAVQVFEEACRKEAEIDICGSAPSIANAAFREFCRAWNIAADKPLGGDAE